MMNSNELIGVEEKDFGKLQTKGLSYKTRNLITEKDEDIPEKSDRLANML